MLGLDLNLAKSDYRGSAWLLSFREAEFQGPFESRVLCSGGRPGELIVDRYWSANISFIYGVKAVHSPPLGKDFNTSENIQREQAEVLVHRGIQLRSEA